MKDERHDNVVRFRRPTAKKPPPPQRKPARPARRPGGGEPAINWSRAPKAIALILIFFLVMWLLNGLGGWISGVGVH